MYNFTYHRAASVDDAAVKLSGSEDAKLLSGGMTLLPTMKQRLAMPSDLIDLNEIADLSGISVADGTVTVGATTRHADVAASEDVKAAIPALAKLASLIGDPQVRNRGTIGGSIANNDPAADYPAALVGLGATVVTNTREIPADDFFVDMFETALDEQEIITAVRFPVPEKAAYYKFPNPASRYAVVGVFVAVTGGGVRVAVTGAGPSVFRQDDAEAAFNESFSVDALDGLTQSADGLNEDMHASAEYRAALVVAGVKRAVAQIS